MIYLFEENERSFTSLGLGILKDASSCIIREKLNDEFSLSMEYPVTGLNFDKLKNDRIIFAKPNPYSNRQAFRICNITKEIDGKVIVDANHISYDLNSIPVKALSASGLQDLLVKIQNETVIECPFEFSSDITLAKTYKTTAPYNLRAMLMGDDNSIVSEYNAELEFDNYLVKVLSKRGQNRGAMVKYGRNMVDINHSLSDELLYNGVFPYYHKETTKTETNTSDEFTQAYIVGSEEFKENWLSYTKDGEPYHPVDSLAVQIATQGDYYQKVYVWDERYGTYVEKAYNEQVTLIQGMLEPTWLYIDWSHFPNVVCKAAKTGWFKKMTDTEWGEKKGVGDIIFEGNIASSGLMENLILYFAEVIPEKSNSENTEVTDIIDVQLDDPIIYVETSDAKALKHNKILMLDLTSEFEEEPSKDSLRAKAEEFIKKNKIGTIKHSTTLSFIDLSALEDGSNENMDHIELGDTVRVIYEDANIEVDLRVITTEYDALSGRYESIELGEKTNKMSTSTIQNGDDISALTNDVGYATTTTVNKLIANMITADFIEAINAKLSKAQIKQLEVERIDCKGIFEASQFTLDSLVARMLIAEDAEIANTLKAGKITVSGDITINSGEIRIHEDSEKDTASSFYVDRKGNVKANSVEITGGNFNINDGMFEVTNDGVLTAKGADIEGTIRAKDGNIGDFTLSEGKLSYGIIGQSNSFIIAPAGVPLIIENLDPDNSHDWVLTFGNKFGIEKNGSLYATDVHLKGSIDAKSGFIANFMINENNISTYTVNQQGQKVPYGWLSTGNGIYLGEQGLKLGDSFKVGTNGKLTLLDGEIQIQNGQSQTYFHVYDNGNLEANSVDIRGGSLTIGGTQYYPAFKVTNTGTLTSTDAYISGSVHINSGEIILTNSVVHYVQDTTVNASTYRASTYYYLDSDQNYVLDTSYTYTEGRQYYKVDTSDLYVPSFYVDKDGNMFAKSAKISGMVDATSGHIAGFTIDTGELYYIVNQTDVIGANGSFFIVPEGASGTVHNVQKLDWVMTIGTDFGVTSDGKIYSANMTADSMVATNAIISSGTIANFKIETDKLYIANKLVGQADSFFIAPTGVSGTVHGITKDNWVLTIGMNFGVDKTGRIYAHNISATGGSFSGSIDASGSFSGYASISSGIIGNTNLVDVAGWHKDTMLLDVSSTTETTTPYKIAAINTKARESETENFLVEVDPNSMELLPSTYEPVYEPRFIHGSELLQVYRGGMIRAVIKVVGTCFIKSTYNQNTDDRKLTAVYPEPQYWVLNEKTLEFEQIIENTSPVKYVQGIERFNKYTNDLIDKRLLDRNVPRFTNTTYEDVDYMKFRIRHPAFD